MARRRSTSTSASTTSSSSTSCTSTSTRRLRSLAVALGPLWPEAAASAAASAAATPEQPDADLLQGMAGWTDLTPEQRTSFDDDGFLVVRGCLMPHEVAALTRAGDHLHAHAEDYWDARGQERNLLAADPDNFLQMLTHPVSLPLVAQLMGPRLQLHTSQFLWNEPNALAPDSPHLTETDPSHLGWVSAHRNLISRRPPERRSHLSRLFPELSSDSPRYNAQHRDIAEMTGVIGLGVMPRVEIKVMFYLSDCAPGFGQTWLARGSHKWQPGGDGPYQGVEAKERIVTEGRTVEPDLKAGDALFFENRCFHSGAFGSKNDTIPRLKMTISGSGYQPERPAAQDFRRREHASSTCAHG